MYYNIIVQDRFTNYPEQFFVFCWVPKLYFLLVINWCLNQVIFIKIVKDGLAIYLGEQ